MNVATAELSGWDQISVKQFWLDSCIAAVTEWALRYHNVPGISYHPMTRPLSGELEELESVQQDLFGKMKNGQVAGSFGGAATYVRDNFGNSVRVDNPSFDKTTQGAEQKIRAIEAALLSQDVPIVSITQPPEETNFDITTWHMYPVVGIGPAGTLRLYDVAKRDNEQPVEKSIDEVIEKHVSLDGGEDLLIVRKL